MSKLRKIIGACAAVMVAAALFAVPSTAFAANTGLQAGEGVDVETTASSSGLPAGYAYTKQTTTINMTTFNGMVVSNGTYSIASTSDIRNVASISNTNALFSTNQSLSSQKWKLVFSDVDQAYLIKNVATGKYLTVTGPKAKQGANVVLSKKLSRPSSSKKSKSKSDGLKLQLWGIKGTSNGYALYSLSGSNMWLKVSDGNLIVSSSKTGVDKFWLLRNSGYNFLQTGSYTLASSNGQLLGLPSSSIRSNRALSLEGKKNNLSQIFDITYVKDGYYKIVNVNSGMAVTDTGSLVQRNYGNAKKVKSGKKTTTVYTGNNNAQLWMPKLQANGKVKFINKKTNRELNCGGCNEWTVSPTTAGLSVVGKKALWKANKKTSPTAYTIMVDLSWHQLFVFKKMNARYAGGPWKCVGNWRVSTGAPGSRTPARDMKVGHHSYNSGVYNCFYWTTLGYTNFHSVLYNSSRHPGRITDGRLGVNISHGCIRMALKNAKWIYDHCHSGTAVKTYY